MMRLLSKKQIYTEGGYMLDRDNIPNSIKHMNWGLIGIMVATIWIWYSIFTIGFFQTIFYIVLGSLIGALYFNYKENK